MTPEPTEVAPLSAEPDYLDWLAAKVERGIGICAEEAYPLAVEYARECEKEIRAQAERIATLEGALRAIQEAARLLPFDGAKQSAVSAIAARALSGGAE